jgi:type II secretory ATPase GspE/PulE/Tfp pilus assembly ATPase PilB-like protein
VLRHSAIERFLADVASTAGATLAFSPELVDRALDAAREVGASDLHAQPTSTGLELRWRVDGVLQLVGSLPSTMSANFLARLKVLADLLTYRTDVPQEGRLRGVAGLTDVEMRLSTFPTLHGEKAVVRFFGSERQYLRVAELGLPEEITARLRALLAETSGAILVTGPAGSGKTTTLYACLREIAAEADGGRSLASLEDPIEVEVPGVAQSQTSEKAGFDLATGLRFLLRQDPEVILVGEIRDRTTAEVAIQAALTGHLVLSSFHAGSAAGAISRLGDMGIEPYLLRSGVLAIISQRLARRLCDCARPSTSHEDFLGLELTAARVPVGCEACHGAGYRGRIVLAEMLSVDSSAIGRAILSRSDAAQIEQLAVSAGMISRWQRACAAIEAGLTSPGEVRRVLGFADPGSAAE